MQGGVSPTIEVPFERGVGMFLRNSERGFRGLDFQARLVWENHYGACARPAWVTERLHRHAGRRGRGGSDRDRRGCRRGAQGSPRSASRRSPTAPSTDALAAIVGRSTARRARVTARGAARRSAARSSSRRSSCSQGIAGRGGDRAEADAGRPRGYDAVCADVASHVTRGDVHAASSRCPYERCVYVPRAMQLLRYACLVLTIARVRPQDAQRDAAKSRESAGAAEPRSRRPPHARLADMAAPAAAAPAKRRAGDRRAGSGGGDARRAASAAARAGRRGDMRCARRSPPISPPTPRTSRAAAS